MAAYFDIPDETKDWRKFVNKESYDPQLKEVLIIYLGGNKNLLKLVLDYDFGRDYSGHTVLYRERLDPSTPETWEAQVHKLIDKI